jgi:hypothetical protein
MFRLWLLCLGLVVGSAAAQDAGALRARHAALVEELTKNPFGRPLHVESKEASGAQQGNIFAILDLPYRDAAPALQDEDRWCGILILPPNVKRCESDGALALYVARKPQDPLEDAYRVALRYEVAAASADYLRVTLSAPTGPFGTRDYRIRLEAAPLDARRTFIHLSYSYELGLAARIAMQGYFATSGRDKVGFTVVDRLPDGRPVYVDGARGLVERNAMRYYLAVEAYLRSLRTPAEKRLETRLRDWYAAVERYPQLDEDINREEYLRLKRQEAGREAALAGSNLAEGEASQGGTVHGSTEDSRGRERLRGDR